MNFNYTEPAPGYGASHLHESEVLFNRYRYRCPVFRRPENGDDFEVNQVLPSMDPFVQRIQTGRLHDLETAGASRVHPTRLIDDACGQHPSAAPKPFAYRLRVAAFEAFNDHKKRALQCTFPAPPHNVLQFVPLR